jgi:alpha-aminoadipic semialdehyde synthase
MKDDYNRRLVLFSRFAGYAGMMDGLNGLGHQLLVSITMKNASSSLKLMSFQARGYGGPFLACGLSYMYRCLADARLDMTRTGQAIMDDGLPRVFGPLVFVFTGDGNVTKVNGLDRMLILLT